MLVINENLLFIPRIKLVSELARERALAWLYLPVSPRGKGLDPGDKAFLQVGMKSPAPSSPKSE